MEERARDDELGGDMPVEREIPTGYTAEPSLQRPRWVIPLLASFLVVALSTAAVFGFLYLNQDASSADVGVLLTQQSPEVEDIAQRVANLLMNYDSTNLEEVSMQMLTIATGNFREQYEDVLASGEGLGPALEEASASSRGQITDGPDVYFRTATEAIALVGTTQFAQSNSNPGGSTIDYVLKITLIDTQDGGWKADRVEVLSTNQLQ